MPGSGLDAMIDADRIDDLQRLYRLFVHASNASDGPQILKKALRESIVNRGRFINDSGSGIPASSDEKGKGKARVGALEDALVWVQDSLNLKAKFDRVLKHAFDSDKGLETTIIEVSNPLASSVWELLIDTLQALETFVNSNPRAPEYTSLFIDENLKKGLKGVSVDIIPSTCLTGTQKTDDEIELVLDRTITLFRFITEKDAFERYYKGHLARRLLSGRSVSDDAERGMLAKLKVECGFQFTKKMEGMFQDMKVSADTTSAYKDYIQSTGVCFPLLPF
jgi:cullin 3